MSSESSDSSGSIFKMFNSTALLATVARSSNGPLFEKKGSSLPQGELRDTVESDLINMMKWSPGERGKWMKSAVVKTIYYCSRALKGGKTEETSDDQSYPRPDLMFVNHEFLIVEVTSEGSEVCVFIQAEKTAPNEAEQKAGGVSISVIPAKPSGFEENVIYSFLCNVQVHLKDVLDALETDKNELRYQSLTTNCWDYAIGAFEEVLSVLANAETDPIRKKGILEEKKTLKIHITRLRIVPNTK